MFTYLLYIFFLLFLYICCRDLYIDVQRQGDPHGHGDLRAKRTATEAQAPRKGIGHQTAQQGAEGGHHLTSRVIYLYIANIYNI